MFSPKSVIKQKKGESVNSQSLRRTGDGLLPKDNSKVVWNCKYDLNIKNKLKMIIHKVLRCLDVRFLTKGILVIL